MYGRHLVERLYLVYEQLCVKDRQTDIQAAVDGWYSKRLVPGHMIGIRLSVCNDKVLSVAFMLR